MNRLNRMGMVCAVAAAMLAACGGGTYQQQMSTTNSLQLAARGSLGNILVDGNGRALYYFARDLPAGGGSAAVSHCNGSAGDGSSCVYHWPIFHAGSGSLGAGISASDVGEFTRADGLAQTTYKGFPLYYFLGDATAGAVNGESVDDWFVLRDPFYSVVTLDGGTTRMTDAAGRSLYVFDRDTVGTPPTSACAGTPGDRTTCVGNWPIFFAATVIAPTGIDSSRFTVFTRGDGRQQTAFDGHPLYYFADDVVPGDLKGLTFPPGLPHWSTIGPNLP